MKKVTCLFLILIMAFTFTSCKNNQKNPSNQTIYYNLFEDPDSLDPQVASNSSSEIVITNIFEGLTRIDENNNVVLGACKRFSHSNDYTSFTFYLRDDIFWSDENKTPVTTEDFIYGINRALSKEINSPNVAILFCIKNAKQIHDGSMPPSSIGMTAINSKIIQIDLEYSYNYFARIMAFPSAMPCNKIFFESTNGQYGQDDDTIICNGPFRLKRNHGWEHNDKIHLLRNEDYSGNTPPVPAGIDFLIGNDVSDLIGSIDNAKIDAGPLPLEQLEKAKSLNYNITSFEGTTFGICFNFDNEILKNLNVRKSFIVSLDRDYILRNIPDNCTVANGIITDANIMDGKNYRNLVGNNFYLKQEGNPKNYLNLGLKELKVELLPPISVICSDDPKTKSIASCMIENWNNQLGHYFNIKPLSRDDLKQKVKLSDYQISITSITSETNDPLGTLSLFKTNAPSNPCNMKDSYYDSLLNSASEKPVLDKISMYKTAEEYLNNKVAFYPLYYQNRYFASAPNVKGIIFYQHNPGINFIKTNKTKK